MKKFVIMGLEGFGAYFLEALRKMDYDILIFDTDENRVDKYKDSAIQAYYMTEFNQDNLRKLVPEDVEAVILGLSMELNVLVAHYLKRMDVGLIVARADSESYAEILENIGVDKVVIPDKEAVKKLVPSLASPLFSSYHILGHGVVAVELKTPQSYWGKTPLELSLRRNKGVNIIAIQYHKEADYDFTFDVGYLLTKGDRMLLYGKEELMDAYIEELSHTTDKEQGVLAETFSKLFKTDKSLYIQSADPRVNNEDK